MRFLFPIRRARLACPTCGHEDVRPSRRTPSPVARALGLRSHRCMGCFRRLLVWKPLATRHASVA